MRKITPQEEAVLNNLDPCTGLPMAAVTRYWVGTTRTDTWEPIRWSTTSNIKNGITPCSKEDWRTLPPTRT